MPENISTICYRRSIDLLANNSTRYGFLASAASERAVERNYLSIFGRDASICAIGASTTGNSKLIKTARASLVTLAKFQAPNGQIANYVKPEIGQIDFWHAGCIDATLWWLIAIKLYDKNSAVKNKLEKSLAKNISKAIAWLSCQEHQKHFLLQQNEASDWADIMPRSGFVLYSNALWYWVKTLYKIKTAEKTRLSANYLFYPWQKIPEKYFDEDYRAKRLIDYARALPESDFYLSYVNFAAAGSEVDIFANLLSVTSGLADKKTAKRIISSLFKYQANLPYPVMTVLRPIEENSKQWREYMQIHNQNFPHQYHNGGIWPFIGGFWVIALINASEKKLARNELARLAEANALNDWQFNEWLHGQTSEPFGMPGQTWNAATFIYAYNHLKQ